MYFESYDPTIEDSYRKQVEVDGQTVELEILDTAGVSQFTAMRELYIKSGTGFLLVYSVTDESSLKELLTLREQVLRIKDSTNFPMVLIGNKCDLNDERVLTPEDGINVSQQWGRVPFYETSARLKTNVEDAFIDVIRQIIIRENSSLASPQMNNDNVIPSTLSNSANNNSNNINDSNNDRNDNNDTNNEDKNANNSNNPSNGNHNLNNPNTSNNTKSLSKKRTMENLRSSAKQKGSRLLKKKSLATLQTKKKDCIIL